MWAAGGGVVDAAHVTDTTDVGWCWEQSECGERCNTSHWRCRRCKHQLVSSSAVDFKLSVGVADRCYGWRTYVSTGFAVVAPLGNGVEWLLTLHAQSHFLLSDGSRSSFPQLSTALRGRDGRIWVTTEWFLGFQELRSSCQGVNFVAECLCYRRVRRRGVIISEWTVQVSETLHCLLVPLDGRLDGLNVNKVKGGFHLKKKKILHYYQSSWNLS